MRKFVPMVVFAIVATLMASNAVAQEVSLTVAAGQPLRAMRPLSMVNSFFVPEVTKRAKAAGITVPSHPDLFSDGFITNIAESSFRHTRRIPRKGGQT